MTTETHDEPPSQTRLEFAQQLFRAHYTRCFWHMRPDLVVSEGMIPAIVKGLRVYGGRAEMLLADRLANWRDK